VKRVFAVELAGRLSVGRNKCLLVTCWDGEQLVDYVLKLKSSEAGVSGLLNEYIAALVATELELNTASAALVELSEDFVQNCTNKDDYSVLKESIGWNYGTVFQASAIAYKHEIHAELCPPESLAALFAWDMLAYNYDREASNPNCLVVDGRLLAIDHDMMFGFLYSIPPARPLDFSDSYAQKAAKQHTCYPYLKGKLQDFLPLLSKFNRLNNDFWGSLSAGLPEEWRTQEAESQIEKIKI
jgi:hypothetical protein